MPTSYHPTLMPIPCHPTLVPTSCHPTTLMCLNWSRALHDETRSKGHTHSTPSRTYRCDRLIFHRSKQRNLSLSLLSEVRCNNETGQTALIGLLGVCCDPTSQAKPLISWSSPDTAAIITRTRLPEEHKTPGLPWPLLSALQIRYLP